MDPTSITAIAAIVTSAFSLGLQLVQSYKLIKVKSSCCEMEMKSELTSSSSSTSSSTKDEAFNENDVKIESSPDSANEEEQEQEEDQSEILNSNFSIDSK